MKTVLIGICGGSASGKTLLATLLQDRLEPERATLLSTDRYYLDAEAFPDHIRGNYDHPEALDMARLLSNLTSLKNGEAAEVPVYDFAKHLRSGHERLRSAPVLIVEGLLLLALKPIQPLLDFTIYVDTPADLRLDRRLERDCRERGRSRESVLQQNRETVAPMHAAHVEAYRHLADHVIAGSQGPALMIDECLQALAGNPQTAFLACD